MTLSNVPCFCNTWQLIQGTLIIIFLVFQVFTMVFVFNRNIFWKKEAIDTAIWAILWSLFLFNIIRRHTFYSSSECEQYFPICGPPVVAPSSLWTPKATMFVMRQMMHYGTLWVSVIRVVTFSVVFPNVYMYYVLSVW